MPARWLPKAAFRIRPPTVFPLLQQLHDYRMQWLLPDVTAGLAIAAVALPVGIAYPEIAGLPPETGLYATILALIGYAIFGPSRQLIVGPDAATMTILAASLAQLAVTGIEERVAASALFAIIVGILCLVSAACRLGFLANFLSRPILTGYLCGISLALLGGQITRLTAVPIESPGLLRPLLELAAHASLIHWPSLITGMTAFLLLRLLGRFAPKVPGPLAVLALATGAALVFDLQSQGVALLGEIHEGVPKLVWPTVELGQLDDLILSAAGILVVSFGSGIVTARGFAARSGQRVHPNHELIGFGAANVASGLFGGFPVTGADSRTAINHVIGGRTQVAGLVAALGLLLVLVGLRDALKYLPVPALGAVLASAACDLFDIAELWKLWRTSRAELSFAIIAISGVLALGVLKGVMIAMAATGAYLVARGARPRDALLGRVPGRAGLYKLHREPRAKPIPGLAIYLVQGSVLFFNSDYVRGRVRWILARLPPTTRWFILDAEAVSSIDSTAIAMLGDIRDDLTRRQMRFGLASLHSQPRKLLRNAGFLASIGPDMVFDHIEDAAFAFEREQASMPISAG